MFIGRERELALLEDRYASGAFEFVPIYGRRRVGKTTLIKRFLEGKDHLYYSAVRRSADYNLGRVAERLFGPGIKASLDAILGELKRRSSDRRFVLVIDEYPNLVKDEEWISDLIQEFIDDIKEDSKLFIILCGSSMNMMEHQVLGYKSPLYGRRTGSIKVEPFDYFQSRQFLEGFTEEDKVRIYGMVGGIPLYLEKFDSTRTLRENVSRNFLREDSFFRNEPEMLMMSEFDIPATYDAIVEAVARGCTKNSEIADAIGIKSSNISGLLNQLCGLGMIGKMRPVDNPGGKMVRYRVEDQFLAFYYRNIFGRYDALIDSEMDEAAEGILESHEGVLGFVFEDICAQFMRSRGEVGTWWGVDANTRTREEIDLVIQSKRDDPPVWYFCECKYTGWDVGQNILDKLVHRAELVKVAGERRYVLFSRSGFTDGMPKRQDLETFTLDGMVASGGRAPVGSQV